MSRELFILVLEPVIKLMGKTGFVELNSGPVLVFADELPTFKDSQEGVVGTTRKLIPMVLLMIITIIILKLIDAHSNAWLPSNILGH